MLQVLLHVGARSEETFVVGTLFYAFTGPPRRDEGNSSTCRTLHIRQSPSDSGEDPNGVLSLLLSAIDWNGARVACARAFIGLLVYRMVFLCWAARPSEIPGVLAAVWHNVEYVKRGFLNSNSPAMVLGRHAHADCYFVSLPHGVIRGFPLYPQVVPVVCRSYSDHWCNFKWSLLPCQCVHTGAWPTDISDRMCFLRSVKSHDGYWVIAASALTLDTQRRRGRWTVAVTSVVLVVCSAARPLVGLQVQSANAPDRTQRPTENGRKPIGIPSRSVKWRRSSIHTRLDGWTRWDDRGGSFTSRVDRCQRLRRQGKTGQSRTEEDCSRTCGRHVSRSSDERRRHRNGVECAAPKWCSVGPSTRWVASDRTAAGGEPCRWKRRAIGPRWLLYRYLYIYCICLFPPPRSGGRYFVMSFRRRWARLLRGETGSGVRPPRRRHRAVAEFGLRGLRLRANQRPE